MESALAIADVHSVVPRTSTRDFVANAAQQRHACRQKARVEWPEKAARGPTDRDSCSGLRYAPCGYVGWVDRDPGIDVDGLVLMQAEHVNIFRLDHRFQSDRPGIPAVPLLCNGVAVIGVHNTASGPRG